MVITDSMYELKDKSFDNHNHWIQQDVLDDESNYLLNYGSGTLRKAVSSQFEVKKYTSFDKSYVGAIMLVMSSQKVFISRETYSLFDLASDIGGAGELIFIVVKIFVTVFSEIKLGALAANRLYS